MYRNCAVQLIEDFLDPKKKMASKRNAAPNKKPKTVPIVHEEDTAGRPAEAPTSHQPPTEDDENQRRLFQLRQEELEKSAKLKALEEQVRKGARDAGIKTYESASDSSDDSSAEEREARLEAARIALGTPLEAKRQGKIAEKAHKKMLWLTSKPAPTKKEKAAFEAAFENDFVPEANKLSSIYKDPLLRQLEWTRAICRNHIAICKRPHADVAHGSKHKSSSSKPKAKKPKSDGAAAVAGPVPDVAPAAPATAV